MERVDLRQKVEGEWEQLRPPMFLEKAVAPLRIRLSDLRARPRKEDSAWDRTHNSRELSWLMKTEPGRQFDSSFSWRRKRN